MSLKGLIDPGRQGAASFASSAIACSHTAAIAGPAATASYRNRAQSRFTGGMRRAVWAFLATLLLCTACGAGLKPLAATTSSPGYVPWLPLAPSGAYPQAPMASPSPPIPIPPGTMPCQASQLDAAYFMSSAATGGNVDSPVRFRNHSATSCYLEGYPDLTLLSAA